MHNGNPFAICGAPCRILIDIANGNICAAVNQRHKVLKKQFAQMTVSPAVDDEFYRRRHRSPMMREPGQAGERRVAPGRSVQFIAAVNGPRRTERPFSRYRAGRRPLQ